MPVFLDGVDITSAEALINRRDFKESVRLASTADLPLSGLAAIDGVTPVAGNRILAKDQTLGEANGIYIAASGAWTRATDFDEDAEVTSGASVFISEGTANDGDVYTLVTADPIVIGTTVQVWIKTAGSSLIAHGPTHVETGTDPVPNATQSVGGLMSAVDKTSFDNQLPTADEKASFASLKEAVLTTSFFANLTLSGEQTINSVALVSGDRILVVDQTLPENNGIYVVAVGAWSRATDADTAAEFEAGMVIPVRRGSVYGGSLWTFRVPNSSITLGTTALNFDFGAYRFMVESDASIDVTLKGGQAGGHLLELKASGVAGDGLAVGGDTWILTVDSSVERTANKDSANGYAGLNGSLLLDGGQMPYGSASNTVTEGDDARLSDDRTPTAHASTHITSGSDEIDGDQLDIDFTPSNYTPTIAPAEATDLDHLAAHLAGVDVALGSMGPGDVVGPGSATDTAIAIYSGTTGKIIQNSLVTIDGSGNIATSGTVDGRDLSVDGGKLDGIETGATADQSAAEVAIADAGSRYTGTDVEGALQEIAGAGRTTETVKANADNLTAHLNGGANKHDATEIDYERGDGSKKNIQATSDDVENALTDLDDAIGTLVASPTNYTPTAATVTGHQAGIDTALGLLAVDADVIKKDGSVAFTASQSMGTNRLTSLSAGVDPTDAVNKSQLDAVVSGLDLKASVRVATIAILDDNTDISGAPSYNNVGGASSLGQITATLSVSGVFAIDGVTLVDNDRVLVKHEGDGSGLGGDANGIYFVTISGTSLTLDRATDFDSDAEVLAGAFMFIEEGTAHGDTGWVLITNNPITLGGASGTVLTFTQFTSATALSAGDGIDIVSGVVSVDVSDLVGAGIEDDGANNFRISVAAAGAGLGGGGGSALEVNVDGTTIEISTDTLRLAATAAGSGLGGGGAGGALVVNAGDGIQIVTDAVAVTADVERTTNKNSSSGYAGLDSSSRIAKAQGHLTTVYNDQSNTYTAGSKQTFQPSATTAGVNIVTGSDPSSPVQGDLVINGALFKYHDGVVLREVEHTGRKNTANGYPGLSGSALLFGTQMPFGSAADTVAEGNDPRLSDDRDPTAHASDHQNGGGDEVATATPAANAIPKADGGGKLASGWIPDSAGEEIFEWTMNGTIPASQSAVDGARIARRAGTVLGVVMFLDAKGGASGSTIVDINRHVPSKPITTQRDATAGVTIYTTQANRPTLVGAGGAGAENAVIEADVPDVTSFVAGDFFTMDIDARSSTPFSMGLVVQLHVKYTS